MQTPGREEEHTKNGSIDLGNAFVPDLTPHVGTSAGTPIQTVLSCELTNVEMESVSIPQWRDIYFLS